MFIKHSVQIFNMQKLNEKWIQLKLYFINGTTVAHENE